MPPARDLTGLTFNDLTGLCRMEGTSLGGSVLWKFRCICGNEVVHRGTGVSKGEKISCGCHKERKRITPRICRDCKEMHIRKNEAGYVGTICTKCHSKRQANFYATNPKNRLVNSARERAQKLGLPFNITPDDFDIPALCPILGTPMAVGPYEERDTSPSIDRVIPELGYVRGNIAVISFRANRFKSDATLDELEKVVSWNRNWIKKVEAERQSPQLDLPLMPVGVKRRGPTPLYGEQPVHFLDKINSQTPNNSLLVCV